MMSGVTQLLLCDEYECWCYKLNKMDAHCNKLNKVSTVPQYVAAKCIHHDILSYPHLTPPQYNNTRSRKQQL